ncbi:MAG: hypothetical protein KIS92_22125 [Planctomycetota bacterium]|nr:hypothetical protein [Planctomycetota bacterium]
MNPQERVQAPGIGLMVVAGIGMLMQFLSVALNLLGIGVGSMAGGEQAFANLLSGAVGLVFNFIAICIAFVIFMGARKMMSLENYGLAMAGAIVAMIPCISPCCLIGLPVGIWALVTLMDPDVKAAFPGQGPRPGTPPAPPAPPQVPPTVT